MTVVGAASDRRELPPVGSRWRWIAWGLALQVIGVVLFAVGAVLVARPFVRRPATLLVVVPLSAVAGSRCSAWSRSSSRR